MLDLSDVPQKDRAKAEAQIRQFINRTPTPRFDCASLPKETHVTELADIQNHLKGFYRYQLGLHYLTGSLWRIFGPSWELVGLLASAFAAGFFVCLYALSRMFLGSVPSIVIASFVSLNSMNIFMVPQLRDYSKTMFVSLSVILLSFLLLRPLKNRTVFLIGCLLLGLFFGFGTGFRNDMLSTGALFMVIILLMQPVYADETKLSSTHKFSYSLTTSMYALVVFTLGVFVFVYPATQIVPFDHVSNEGHLLLLGLSDFAFEHIGWSTRDLIFNPSYQDLGGYTLIEAYASAVLDKQNIGLYGEVYNSSSLDQVIDYAIYFPYDVFSRIFYIIFDIISSGSIVTPRWLAFDTTNYLLFANSLFAMTVAFFRNKRIFLYMLLLLSGFSAMLSLQYIGRHYFHIHLIWLCVCSAISISTIIRFVLQKLPDSISLKPAVVELFLAKKDVMSLVPKYVPGWVLPTFVVGSASLVISTILLQHYSESSWRDNVVSQPTTAAIYNILNEGGGTKLDFSQTPSWIDFRGKEVRRDWAEQNIHTSTGGFLEIRFRSQKECRLPITKMQLSYEAENSAFKLDHVIEHKLDPEVGSSRYTPVFFTYNPSINSYFGAISFSEDMVDCLEGVYWVENFPKIKFPIGFSQKHMDE